MEKQLMEISWSSLWRILFMVFFAVALYFLRDVLMVLFMALIISSALDAPISFLETKKIPRVLGTIFVFLAAFLTLVLLLYTIVPVAFIELKNLLEGLAKIELPTLGFLKAPQFIEQLKDNFSNITNLLTAIFGGIASIIAVFVLSFYLALSREGVKNFLKAILPAELEDYAISVYLSTKRKLGFWLEGQLILSLIVGLAVFLGLLILGVEYSLVLGVLAGLLELVPFVGPIFAGTLAFLIAVSESWTLGILVIVLFILINQAESHLLIPAVMKKIVGIHPVVVIIALLAGVTLAGFAGVILAVPAAVVVQEIIESRISRKNQVGRFNFRESE